MISLVGVGRLKGDWHRFRGGRFLWPIRIGSPPRAITSGSPVMFAVALHYIDEMERVTELTLGCRRSHSIRLHVKGQ